MDLIETARVYAQAAHRAIGQKRKYTGECYTCLLYTSPSPRDRG